LIKLIVPILLAIIYSTAHADEHPELSTSLADSAIPLTLTSARNIKLTLIPDDDLNNIDLWQRLRGGFAMQELNSPLIAKHEQWYASRPEYIARMMDRGSRYLYYITGEVERRGMPSEIALLPMIESAFNPGAYSTSNASGIWQFIPSTGKNFGLQQNWWYDGRRDIVSATTGALDYLEKLHAMFGDWELALAAYNWGEGAVSRAQERNRKQGLAVNYASLKLPDETRNYLPKLLAIKNIVANPGRFGLTLPDISNQPYFAAVSSAKHIDMELAAQLADISREEFIALNPAHNRPVILQDNSDFILLPINKIETYQANLENYDKPLVSWQAYYARKGERLDHLAPRFGLSVERLKKVNGLSARSNLSEGEALLVPLNGEPGEENGEFAAFNMHLHPVNKTAQQNHAIKHTVRKGETLAKLARRYHVSVADLKRWNGHTRQIKAGQTITLVQAGSKTRIASEKITRRLAQSKPRKVAQRKTTGKQANAAKAGKISLAYQNK